MNLKHKFFSNKWIQNGFTNQANGIAVPNYIYSTRFWDVVEQVLEFLEPLLKVLGLVDGDKSPMGYLLRPWIGPRR